jgi:hypothetical protein
MADTNYLDEDLCITSAENRRNACLKKLKVYHSKNELYCKYNCSLIGIIMKQNDRHTLSLLQLVQLSILT